MTSVPRALSLRTGVHDDSVMKEMARMSAVTSAVLLADEHPLLLFIFSRWRRGRAWHGDN